MHLIQKILQALPAISLNFFARKLHKKDKQFLLWLALAQTFILSVVIIGAVFFEAV